MISWKSYSNASSSFGCWKQTAQSILMSWTLFISEGTLSQTQTHTSHWSNSSTVSYSPESSQRCSRPCIPCFLSSLTFWAPYYGSDELWSICYCTLLQEIQAVWIVKFRTEIWYGNSWELGKRDDDNGEHCQLPWDWSILFWGRIICKFEKSGQFWPVGKWVGVCIPIVWFWSFSKKLSL